MAEKKRSDESKVNPLLDLNLPTGEGKKERPPRFLNPEIVAAHFAPLLKNIPSAEERWQSKKNAKDFTWP